MLRYAAPTTLHTAMAVSQTVHLSEWHIGDLVTDIVSVHITTILFVVLMALHTPTIVHVGVPEFEDLTMDLVVVAARCIIVPFAVSMVVPIQIRVR